MIDNQVLPKSKIDVIAKKVLNNCNFTHNKKEPKQKIMKGKGKMSITAGLTIEEFNKKFNIPK